VTAGLLCSDVADALGEKDTFVSESMGLEEVFSTGVNGVGSAALVVAV